MEADDRLQPYSGTVFKTSTVGTQIPDACLARRWWGIDPWFTPLSHLDFGFSEGLDSSLVASSAQENCEAGMPRPMS